MSSCIRPERIDPGVEAHAPDSTPRVVGGVTEECTRRAGEVLSHTASTLHSVSSPETAETTKLLENTFRAVNIALERVCGRGGELRSTSPR